ncbi:hypothetical protein [Desulfosporosinus sp. FKB]|uniref:hypothetical protein n=1 Tax=Desulfosporosinus sp. FKB TaxID=1969835 RepID=UPI001481E3F5|nr:hypothetical protein [Desulfosporosinus sp. FKB]
MDFATCSKCLYGQTNICDAFMLHQFQSGNGVTDITWQGGGCPFYNQRQIKVFPSIISD